MSEAALIRAPARVALARLRSGTLTAETYVEAFLARISARDEAVRGWAWLDPDAARSAAKQLDAAGRGGPLHGLPVALKDVIQTADMPTGYNSSAWRGHRPGVDAAVVTRLRQAGALILGKTTTVEFAAVGRPPDTRNPHDSSRTPGGSSSGSAAVVADLQAPVSIGTQTGGSMIRPAGFCGTPAFKPTWGRVSNEGARRFAPSLDTLGWYGRSIDDLELLWSVLGDDTASAPSVSERVGPRRIALCRTPVWDRAEPATEAAVNRALAAYAAAGWKLVTLDFPDAFAGIVEAQQTVMYGEGRISFRDEAERHPEALAPAMREMVARPLDMAGLIAARDLAARARAWFDREAAAVDAVLAPSTVGEAPVGLDRTGDLIFNGLWTLLHTPVVHVPVTVGPAGLPVGVSVIAGRGGDRAALDAARTLEAALAGISPAG